LHGIVASVELEVTTAVLVVIAVVPVLTPVVPVVGSSVEVFILVAVVGVTTVEGVSIIVVAGGSVEFVVVAVAKFVRSENRESLLFKFTVVSIGFRLSSDAQNQNKPNNLHNYFSLKMLNCVRKVWKLNKVVPGGWSLGHVFLYLNQSNLYSSNRRYEIEIIFPTVTRKSSL